MDADCTKTALLEGIVQFVEEDEGNWSQALGTRYFQRPLIGIADGLDPLFGQFRDVVGPGHMSPMEVLEGAVGPVSTGRCVVVSVAIPISPTIRESNRKETFLGSKAWAHLRHFADDLFLDALMRHMVEELGAMGWRAVAPRLTNGYKLSMSAEGPISNWSERHVAFAAGLGTFSLNDGFITEQGIAVRLISVVTDAEIAADRRTAVGHMDHCSRCRACVQRCPVGAIDASGHDRLKCMAHVYGSESRSRAVANGADASAGSGCGLCQTKVPCEARRPIRRRSSRTAEIEPHT